MKSKNYPFFFILFIFPFVLFGKGYRIEFQLPEKTASVIFLAHYFGDKVLVIDSLQLDKKNHGVFKGDTLLDQGIYMLATQKHRFFDFLVENDQSIFIEANSSTEIENLKILKSKEAQRFLCFQQEMSRLKKMQQEMKNRLELNSTNPDSISVFKGQLVELDREVNLFWKKEIEKNQHNFYGKFIRAMMAPEMPPSKIPDTHPMHDSLQWVYEYNWRKDHFFDHIDFGDDRLLRTPVFHRKMMLYFNKFLLQIPDSINRQVDKVLARARSNGNMFRYMANFLLKSFKESKIMGMDASFVHLAENYYLTREIQIDSLMYEKLYREVQLLKPTLIGTIARDLLMEDPEGIHYRLHQMNADYSVVLFWEPDCGHCRVQVPQLYKEVFLPLREKGVKVFAVYTQDDKEKWIDFIQKNNLYEWINVYDPENLSHFRSFYKIETTPVIYILDHKKRIVAKNIDIPTVQKWLENHLR